MKTNPITVAARAKGSIKLIKRARVITRRYGFTHVQMDLALQRYVRVLEHFNVGATFPITAVTLKRHGDTISQYLDQNIEFAVHGFTHIDYAQVPPEAQLAHLEHACEAFAKAGIVPMGFRSPYLRRESHLYTAIEKAGFSYVSNQPILWDILETDALSTLPSAYDRAIIFYEPWQSSERVSLPQAGDRLIEIPIALPDDEMLVERLGATNGLVERSWLYILSETYQRGELFVLQLHPERIALCSDALEAVLVEARELKPAVWCARLDEIAAWWKARSRTTIEITDIEDCGYLCIITGPTSTTVLAAVVDIDVPTQPWASDYRRVNGMRFTVHAPLRPFIGVSPSSSGALTHFLRQQGYIVEISQDSNRYKCYFDQANFDVGQERQVLAQIEKPDCPLVRLGLWPNGAQSALAITGDIDALTLWDYGLRAIGK